MFRPVVVYALVLIASVLPGSGRDPAQAPPGSQDPPRLITLLNSDFVVRARVEAVESSLVSARQFDPGFPAYSESLFVRVSRASLDAVECLKGRCPSTDLVVVSDNSFDLQALLPVGAEMIVAVDFRAEILGGSHVLAGPSACFVRDGANWVNRGVQYPDSEIRTAIRAVEPASLAIAADAILRPIFGSHVPLPVDRRQQRD